MTERFQVLRLDEVDGYAAEGRPRWHMIRAVLGIESFGINAWRATEAGQEIIGDHDELGQGAGGHEELYLVLSGRATFTLDGDLVAAPAGTLVSVKDPRARRSAIADEAATTILVIGGRPGEAFTISPWERSAEALRFWTTGEWDQAMEVLEAQLDEDPGDLNVVYNLACAEARAGRHEASLEHLARAVELEPHFAELRKATRISTPSATTTASRSDPTSRRRRRSGVPHHALGDDRCGTLHADRRSAASHDDAFRSDDARRRTRRRPEGAHPSRGREKQARGRVRDVPRGEPPSGRDLQVRRRATRARPRGRTPCGPAHLRTGRDPPAGATGEDVAVGDRPHRHVCDEGVPVARRDGDRERVRAGQRGGPEGAGSRRGEVAVSSATWPAAARRLTQYPSTPVGKQGDATTSRAPSICSVRRSSQIADNVT